MCLREGPRQRQQVREAIHFRRRNPHSVSATREYQPAGQHDPTDRGARDGRAGSRSNGRVGQDVSVMLLVPADPLRPRRPDEHFAARPRRLVRPGSLWRSSTTTRWPGRGCAAGGRRVSGSGAAVYRGWMLRSGRYAAFADALAERGVSLRTYASSTGGRMSCPAGMPALAAVTPTSVWTRERTGHFERRAPRWGGPAVVRDYTKSMKHYWHEAAYIPDLADAAGVDGGVPDAATARRRFRRRVRAAPLRAVHRRGGAHLVDRRRCPLIGAASGHPGTPPPTGVDWSGWHRWSPALACHS